MRPRRPCVLVVFIIVLAAVLAVRPAAAATVRGTVSDATGAVVAGARVVLRGVATGQESSVETGGDGRFQLDAPAPGTYLVIVTRAGFSEAARTVVVDRVRTKCSTCRCSSSSAGSAPR